MSDETGGIKYKFPKHNKHHDKNTSAIFEKKSEALIVSCYQSESSSEEKSRQEVFHQHSAIQRNIWRER